MSRDQVEILHLQLSELRERVVRLETYVKVVGAAVTIIPTALQIWNIFK